MKIARYPLFGKEREGEGGEGGERGREGEEREALSRRWFHFKGEMNQIFHEGRWSDRGQIQKLRTFLKLKTSEGFGRY